MVDQAFTRVGGASKVHVDLRVISSTTKHLPNEISEGRFREELYHRLNVVPIEVPSLEARSEDIPVLAEYFIEMFHREQGLALRKIADDAMATLQTMRWPGNVRQLRNLIERVLILGEGTGPISLDDLPMSDEGKSGTSEASLSPGLTMLPLREARELFERQYLMAQINRFGGNISRTAGFVGMERSALHRKLKSLGVVTSGKTQAGEEVE